MPLDPEPAAGTLHPIRRAGFFNSFVHAYRGLIHTVVHQHNMRVHLVSALLVGLVGSGLPLGLAEKVTLIFCVLFMFFAEILNSALEALVDLATRHFDEKARVTKDAAAAGVLVLATGTVVIFAAILVTDWDLVMTHLPQVRRQTLLGAPLTVAVSVLVADVKKAALVDAALFVAGVVLVVALFSHTESYVFTAMTLGLVWVAGASAFERRKLRAA